MSPEKRDGKERPKGATLFRILILSFSLVSIFSCLLIGSLTYALNAARIRSDQYRLLEALRDEKIATMSAWFREKSSDVSILVARQDIRAFFEAQDGGRASLADDMASSLTIVQRAYGFMAVFLADKNGITIVSTEAGYSDPGNLRLRQASVQQVIREKVNIVSDVLISKIHGTPTIFFFAPVVTSETAELVGVLGILIDPEVSLYPKFTKSEYLGETGELLLVNSDGLVQSPLRHRDSAVSSMIIHAEPAQRGAAGQIGRIAVDDYRSERVMATYGHIGAFRWGIVVKQDMAEINVPVRSMAANVVGASAAVLAISLVAGFFIARRISRPALRIAETADDIGHGNLDVRLQNEGPAEIRQIASNMNTMVARLGAQVRVTRAITDIIAAAGRHKNLSDLLDEILPLLMETTLSQSGAVYHAGTTENILDQVLVHGLNAERIAKQITINPPDHLLAESLSAGSIRVLKDIRGSSELFINTQAGVATPHALLSIPLILRGTSVGVVGLASLYDYDDAAQQIAGSVRSSLAQAVEICRSYERLEELGRELGTRNEELLSTTEELQNTTEEQKGLLIELGLQQQQVAEADRLKSEFLSNMSHELRTPLNSVLSLSQLMLSNGIGAAGGEDRERVEIIERNGRHLLNLINDILDLSKLESGKMDIFLSSFAVDEPVEEVVAAIRPMANEKGLAVIVEIDEMDYMQSDQDKLQQILLNLMANAQKFTERGEIGIAAQRIAGNVVFTVRDTGCGIAEDALPYIFDEFRQADGSTTRRHGGTGLGLAISRRLASLLEGEIDVTSEEGKGTTFTVTLPMAIGNQHLPAVTDRTPNTHSIRKWQNEINPPRILVVDDDDVASKQIRTALVSNGFLVDVAENGEVALAKVAGNIPDGIVLDLMMPGFDGFRVLHTLRSMPETAHLPVLVLTAKDLTAEERVFLTNGNVHQLIQKGEVNREQLVKSVSRLVGMPYEETPNPESRVPPRRPAVQPMDGKATILIVDDDPDNMRVTKDILRGMDAHLLEARDGKEAVDMAKSERPDIIVMDINLPVMSGLEATNIIRQDKGLQNIVIIALTAKAMVGDREAILSAGFDEYLSKPVEPDKLKATIRKWIVGEMA